MRSSRMTLKKTRKRSWRINLVWLMGMLPLLFSCAGGFHYSPDKTAVKLGDKPLSLIVASDLHFLAPELTDGGAEFTETVDNADGKMTRYSEVVLDAFLEEVSLEKPDALLLSGDLTFNGEKLSHQELASKLLPLRKAGIPVLLIPGNHDINYPYSFAYSGSEVSHVDNVSEADFLSIYQDVTFSHVLSFDADSLSYVYPLREDVWLLALSADGDSLYEGRIPDSTLSWAEKELDEAKKKGIKVVGMTHESVLEQNPHFSALLYNASEVEDLYVKEGVLANFSGHLHIQHFKDNGTFPDFCTSSLVVSPSHYAKVSVSSSSFAYTTSSVDVESYAKKEGFTDPNLLSFSSYSKAFFKSSNEKRIRKKLADASNTEEEKEAMVTSYLELNDNYFAGKKTEESLYSEGFALWKKSDLSFAGYVQSMLAEDQLDYNAYEKALL